VLIFFTCAACTDNVFCSVIQSHIFSKIKSYCQVFRSYQWPYWWHKFFSLLTLLISGENALNRFLIIDVLNQKSTRACSWLNQTIASNLLWRNLTWSSLLKNIWKLWFAASFWGISQLDSSFFALRWFKLLHTYIQVTNLHQGHWV